MLSSQQHCDASCKLMSPPPQLYSHLTVTWIFFSHAQERCHSLLILCRLLPESFYCTQTASFLSCEPNEGFGPSQKTIIVGYCSPTLLLFRATSLWGAGYRMVLSGPAVLDYTEEINVKCDSQSLGHFGF